MNPGFGRIVYPVKDLQRAKALYSRLLGAEPYFENPYYAGFKAGDQEIGLDPNGHKAGMTGPLPYCRVADIKATLQALLAAGAQTEQAVKDVGGGRLTATVKDADGNVIGLMQNG